MSRDIDLLALVAPNGLGHFRRQVGILSRLLDRLPHLRIHLLCSDFQMASGATWERSSRFFGSDQVTWTGGVLDPGVTWSTEGNSYEGGILLSWMDRCRKVPELGHARVVVSDNLGTVLALRPDAVLAGSFLWGDVLSRAHPMSRPVQSFAQLEADLLERYRPPMLCVKDIVMPEVVAKTAAVPLGWMCESDAVVSLSGVGKRKVGILGGATGSANALLSRLASALAHGGYALAVPNGIQSGNGSVELFRHQAEDFSGLAAAVCRPGIGTVTDCIGYGIPMVTVSEGPVNPELLHNGARLQSLGVAIDLGADPSEDSVRNAVEHIIQPEFSEQMRSRMRALPRNGLEEAVAYLARRLEDSPS